MKTFCTYLIATLLFGLCLFEKESRKKALESESGDTNYLKISRKWTAPNTDPNSMINSEFVGGNNLVSDDRFSLSPSSQFIATDSLQINFEVKENQVKSTNL